MISEKKIINKVLKGIIALILAAVAALLVTKGVYDGIFDRYDTTVSVDAALRTMVAERKEITFSSGEYRLNGYYYSPKDASALVVLAPGMDALADDYLWQIKSFLAYGYGVFAFDPTGSGESEGKNGVGFSQELLDLNAALDYLKKNRYFGCEHVLLFGHSRGGYAVCNVVAMRSDVDAVVSVSGINSAMEAVIEPATHYVGPLAYGGYPMLWLYQSMLFGSDIVNMQADESLNKSGVPALIVHGKEDRQVSPKDGAVYAHQEEITSRQVTYYLAEEEGSDGHTDLLFDADGTANRRLMAKIHVFYQEILQ